MQPSTDAAVFPSYLRPYPHCGAYANGYPLGPQFYHSAVSLQYPLPQSVAASSSYHTPSGSSSPSDHSDEDCGSLGDNPAVQRTLFRPIDFDNCDTGGSSGPSPLPPASAYFPPTPSSSSSQNSEADERSCSGRSSSSSAHGVTASVLDKEMWDSFNSVGNEMIVTKPGRWAEFGCRGVNYLDALLCPLFYYVFFLLGACFLHFWCPFVDCSQRSTTLSSCASTLRTHSATSFSTRAGRR